ncbi:aminoglycoside phosphotransferase family protein [Candidatus Campbellbacteria bacterium]|nr:MAG: aminoglycoside phosphotransferase family protein [Candidatus Campbellbacteria bacterium]
MGFEQKKDLSSQEDGPNTEGFEGVVFEHLIEGSKIIGSGKDGVVFRLFPEEMDPPEVETLVHSGMLSENDIDSHAVKILKIYQRGKAREEYDLHARAFAVLQEAGGYDAGLCCVPTISSTTHQNLTERAQQLLNSYDAKLGREAELLLMEYVDGKDLGTVMYEHVLKHDGLDEVDYGDMTFDEKEAEVGRILGFERPNLEGKTPEEEQSARSITFARNEQKLIKHLRQSGFVLSPEVLTRIENTLAVLHKKGFYHNDLHKRNVMIGTDGRVFLIDFGRSGGHPEEGGLDDTAGIRMWKPLTMNEHAEVEQKRLQDKRQWNGVYGQMVKSQKYVEEMKKLQNDVAQHGVSELEKRVALTMGGGNKFEYFLVMLKALFGNTTTEEYVQYFITSLMSSETILHTPERKLVQRFFESGFWNETTT